MFGYACNENEAYMPFLYTIHELLKELESMKSLMDTITYYPDAKVSKVSVEYEAGKVKRIDQVVMPPTQRRILL